MAKQYAIEIRKAPEYGGWQWEVWAANELTMVAQGWAKSRQAAELASVKGQVEFERAAVVRAIRTTMQQRADLRARVQPNDPENRNSDSVAVERCLAVEDALEELLDIISRGEHLKPESTK